MFTSFSTFINQNLMTYTPKHGSVLVDLAGTRIVCDIVLPPTETPEGVHIPVPFEPYKFNEDNTFVGKTKKMLITPIPGDTFSPLHRNNILNYIF